MFTKFVFTISQALLILILIISGCKDSDNPSDGDKPPCLECPFDFGLTDFEPAWSPDGKTIAYVHGDTVVGKTGIWLIDTNGTNKRILYSSIGAYSPTWSPEGKWIAFSDGGQIYKMRITGDSLTQLTVAGRNFFPAWSPDGQWIAYDRSIADGSGPAGVWIMKTDGMQKEAVASGRYPFWSPTGDHLVFIGWYDSTRGGVIKLSLHTRSKTLLFDGQSKDTRHPRYSPDGTKIAFWSSGNLWLMDTTGVNLNQLTTNGVDVSFGLPFSWSSAGDKIIYTRYRANDWTMNNGVLWLLDIQSGMQTPLTFNP